MTAWNLKAPLRATVRGTVGVSGDVQSQSPLNTATLSGPSTGVNRQAIQYTVTFNQPAQQTTVVTPSATNGATVAPGSFNVNAGGTSGSFTVTRTSTGSTQVDFTTSPVFTYVNRPITLSTVEPTATLTGPSTGVTGSASTFTISLNVTADQAYTFSVTAPGATLSTASPVIAQGQSSTTFTVTRASDGTSTVTLTHPSLSVAGSPVGHTTSSSVQPFLLVRTSQRFTTLGAAVSVAQSGDTIRLAAGNYTIGSGSNQPGDLRCLINLATLTIEWETPGSRPFVDYSALHQGRGFGDVGIEMGPSCTNLTIRGVSSKSYPFNGSGSSGGWAFLNVSSGYPYSGTGSTPYTLLVEDCRIEGWSHAAFTGPNFNGTTTWQRNVVLDCGAGDGLTHSHYFSANGTLNFIGNTVRIRAGGVQGNSMAGSLLKSRVRNANIYSNVFIAEEACNRCLELDNGGVADVRGNVFIRAAVPGNPNQVIRYGPAQGLSDWQLWDQAGRPAYNTSSNYVNDGRSHSLRFQQNTLINRDGANSNTLQVDYYWLGVSSGPRDLNGNVVQPTLDVRGNLVAGTNSVALLNLGAVAGNNTQMQLTDFQLTTGRLLAGSVAGSWADAVTQYAGEHLAPTARSDTNRGAYQLPALPSWIPATAWQWTNIPSSTLGAVLRDDGVGVDAVGRSVPIPAGAGGVEISGFSQASYAAIIANGGPCYSPKRKEMYWHGGGHNSTSNNILAAQRLGKNTPDVVVLSDATPFATRQSNYSAGLASYHSDGKPRAAHVYRNLNVLDGIDEIVQVTLSAMDGGPITDLHNALSVPGIARGAGHDLGGNGLWRTSGYWPDVPNVGVETSHAGGTEMLCVPDPNGTGVYFSRAGGPLRRLNSNRTYTQVTASGVDWTNYGHGGIRNDTRKMLWLSGDGGRPSPWYARFIDLNTGAQTAITVTGTYPSGYSIQGVEWIASLDRWALCFALGGAYKIFLGQETGASTMTMVEQATTGSAPTDINLRRRMYWDADYQCLIFAQAVTQPLVALKAASPWPLSISADGRYIQKNDGTPVMLFGDAIWSLATNCTRAQVDAVLADRAAKGCNCILLEFIEHEWTNQTPKYRNKEGNDPFTNMSGPNWVLNDAYWQMIDYVVNKAKEYGLIIMANPAYWGVGDGWATEIQSASDAALQAYGAALAARYTQGNIIWCLGGDNAGDNGAFGNYGSGTTPGRTKQWQIALGIRSVRTTDLITGHTSRNTNGGVNGEAYKAWTTGYTGFNLNNIYSLDSTSDAPGLAATAWGRGAPWAFFNIEAGYENEDGNDVTMVVPAIQSVLGGALVGFIGGHDALWHMGSYVPNTGSASVISSFLSASWQGGSRFAALMSGYQWHKLQPQTGSTLVTSSKGSGSTTVCPALASDGSFAMIWTPGSSVTVNMAALAVSSVRARWWDYQTGAFSTVPGSPFANTGSRVFTPTGDKVLVLD